MDYFNIKAVFQHTNGHFQAQWKPNEMQPGLDSEGRLVDKRLQKAKLSSLVNRDRD